jgi:radical SAM superfamily enzyme YgiQ (UPF0313 family)
MTEEGAIVKCRSGDAIGCAHRVRIQWEWGILRVLLISTYEMGRQPFGLASPAAWLRAAGFAVDCADVSRQPLDDDVVRSADLVGLYLPMHTATRLAAPVVAKIKRLNAAARICAFGLYAPLNAEWLRLLGVDAVFGGEFEADLTAYATEISTTEDTEDAEIKTRNHLESSTRKLPRLTFLVPDRRNLPPLDRYATLERGDGTRVLVGYTEASRGCRHLCRHCPIVPIYDGQFRIVQPEVVLADIAAQVAAGARHITFGDPDFFNGPTHARRIVRGLHAAHSDVTFDVTIKIEHLLRHRELLPELRDAGCLFITSAVESVDDEVLARLAKGHTRRDFFAAVTLCRESGVTLVPTFVAFHPWLTLDTYCELIETIQDLDLIEAVAPIQLAIRLLIPHGSKLLELEEIRTLAGPFDPATLTYRWSHPDPRVDRLQEEVSDLVGIRQAKSRGEVFDEIRRLARDRAGRPQSTFARPARARATVPYLNEPWYC